MEEKVAVKLGVIILSTFREIPRWVTEPRQVFLGWKIEIGEVERNLLAARLLALHEI